MILVFQIICLLVTLFVLQQYITLGVSSHMHRLLPLVLGLIGVYNFYNIIEYLTQERILFNKMTYLLLMQVLYLLLFYMLDFLQLKIPDFVADILFTSLVAINLVLIIGFDKRDDLWLCLCDFCDDLYRDHLRAWHLCLRALYIQ